MQQSKNLQQALDVAFRFCVIYAESLPGEPFHPSYKKDKKSFVAIIKSAIQTRRALKTFFKKQSRRLNREVDWKSYEKDAEKERAKAKLASKYKTDTYIREIFWKNEMLRLAVTFTETLDESFSAGVLSGGSDLDFDDPTLIPGIDPKDPSNMEALEKYALDLATSVTKVTKEKVKTALIVSSKKGLDQNGAKAKVASVIKDDYRAGMIAHTESVSSYSKGKLAVGKRLNAEGKRWEDGQPKACPICKGLNNQVVGLEENFVSDYDSSNHEHSPAHPWCRCYTKLVLKKK